MSQNSCRSNTSSWCKSSNHHKTIRGICKSYCNQ